PRSSSPCPYTTLFRSDLREPGVLSHRAGAGPAHLDPVVAGRVVAGGEHGAGAGQVTGGEVQLIGGGQSHRDDVHALVTDPLAEGDRKSTRLNSSHVSI